MKKSMVLSIIVIIALSAMALKIDKENYIPFKIDQHMAYTAYEDNLNEKEKADIGLMGITSLTSLVNTVTTTFNYAEKVITKVTDFLDKDTIKENIKKWWKVKITVPTIRWWWN